MCTRQAPVPLAQQLRETAPVEISPPDALIILGSFWPYSRRDYESHLVKSFKECCPVEDYQPHITKLCETYAGLITHNVGTKRFDWVARVLGSSEQRPQVTRPLALLETMLCSQMGASSITHLLYRTDCRPPMRFVEQLSGPNVLNRRIRYAAQDLFIIPTSLGGSTLLIDDIYNTGASMHVYTWALKKFAGVQSVTGVNLAATRFKAGKDGLGFLRLDTSRFEEDPGFRLVWLDDAGGFHVQETCPAVQSKTDPKIRYLAEREAAACKICCPSITPKRRLWSFFR